MWSDLKKKKTFKKWKAEIFFPSEKYFVVVLRLKKTQKTNASLLKSTNTPTTVWYITSALLSTWVWGFAVLPDDFPPKSSSLKCCLIIWKIDNLSFQSLIPLKEKAIMLPWINQKPCLVTLHLYKVFGVSVPLRKMCIESCVNSFRLFPLPILIENSIRTLKNAKKYESPPSFLSRKYEKNNQLL